MIAKLSLPEAKLLFEKYISRTISKPQQLHNKYWEKQNLNWLGYKATWESADMSCFASIRPWQQLVEKWYSRQIEAIDTNRYPHPKQLYIHENSRTGKSLLLITH